METFEITYKSGNKYTVTGEDYISAIKGTFHAEHMNIRDVTDIQIVVPQELEVGGLYKIKTDEEFLRAYNFARENDSVILVINGPLTNIIFNLNYETNIGTTPVRIFGDLSGHYGEDAIGSASQWFNKGIEREIKILKRRHALKEMISYIDKV